MKYILYCFLLIIIALQLVSCGPSHPMNYIEVHYRDARVISYSLLSAKDSALVAIPVEGGSFTTEEIPYTSISRLFYQRSTWAYELLGCAGGYATGAAVVYLFTKNDQGRGDGLSGIYGLPFIPLGIWAAHSAADGMSELDFDSPDGRKFLNKRAGHP